LDFILNHRVHPLERVVGFERRFAQIRKLFVEDYSRLYREGVSATEKQRNRRARETAGVIEGFSRRGRLGFRLQPLGRKKLRTPSALFCSATPSMRGPRRGSMALDGYANPDGQNGTSCDKSRDASMLV
jgi:hypothetical protein